MKKRTRPPTKIIQLMECLPSRQTLDARITAQDGLKIVVQHECLGRLFRATLAGPNDEYVAGGDGIVPSCVAHTIEQAIAMLEDSINRSFVKF